ncbi:MAG: Rho termination factor N-terminal domain-containing protein, partial [Micromonosporaceae bacterium]
MSDTTDLTSDANDAAAQSDDSGATPRRRRTGSGLSSMLLAELQSLASSLGITGTGRMRKGEVIAAIQLKQAESAGSGQVGDVARPQKGMDVAERDITSAESPASSDMAPTGSSDAAGSGEPTRFTEPAPAATSLAPAGQDGAVQDGAVQDALPGTGEAPA